MNTTSVNLYDYYSKYAFLPNFVQLDVGEFWAWMVKMWYFFYYSSIDASATV